MHRELPAASILAALLVLVPTPWHWRAGNVATLAMIVWLFAVNVIYAVDSLIWSHTVAKVALVWCDISMCLAIIPFLSFVLTYCALQVPKSSSAQISRFPPHACVYAYTSSRSLPSVKPSRPTRRRSGGRLWSSFCVTSCLCSGWVSVRLSMFV